MSNAMTPREQAAFAAGIETARQMALTAAVTLEIRDDAREVRQQAAVAALQGLAAGLKLAFLDPPPESNAMQRVMVTIAADPAGSGTVECPECRGRLAWARDSHNGHVHAECETPSCLRVMQ